MRIASALPVLCWSGPDEDAREAAVRNGKRVVQITVDLGVNVINTGFFGRPEKIEGSERCFFRSMEELLPIFEFFSDLAGIGFYDRDDTVMVSSVFAEDEDAHDVSRYQLTTITDYLNKHHRRGTHRSAE